MTIRSRTSWNRGPFGRSQVRRSPLVAGALLLLSAVLWSVGPAEAQREPVPGKTTLGTPESEKVARAAMFQLRSPVTPMHTLDMCPNPGVDALRDTIRMAAAEGQSADQIVEGVIARYGEHLRVVPERRGFGLFAWLIPPAVLLLGAGLVVGRLRALRDRPEREPVDPGSITDEDRERLAAALAELEIAEVEEEV
jgi:cytochrome c-type biogenesis protein CcmH/NrfF